MINVTEKELVISIQDSEPKERLELIIHSLVSALRWYAQSEHFKEDDKKAIEITQLLSELL